MTRRWGLCPFSLLLALALGMPALGAVRADQWGSSQADPQEGIDQPILESILIEGAQLTSERILRRELVLTEGEPFDERLARISRLRLLNTGYFRQVDFQLRKGSAPGRVLLVISVVERESVLIGEATYDGIAARQSWSQEGFSSGGLSVSDINLFGSGQSLSAALQSSQPNFFLANLRWSQPRLADSAWSLAGEYTFVRRDDFFSENLKAGPPMSSDDLLEVQTDRHGFLLGTGVRLSNFNALFLEYGFNQLFASYAGGARVDMDRRIKSGASQLSLLRGSFRRESRNDPFLPTEGQTLHLSYEWGAAPLGGHYQYTKLGLKAAQYLPLFSNHSVALQIESGYVDHPRPFFVGFAPNDRLPNDGLSEDRLESDGLSDRTMLLSQDYKPSFAQAILNYSFPIYTYSGPTLYRIRGSLFGGAFDSWDKDEKFFDEIFVPTGLGIFFDTAYGILNFRYSLNFAAGGGRLENLSRF